MGKCVVYTGGGVAAILSVQRRPVTAPGLPRPGRQCLGDITALLVSWEMVNLGGGLGAHRPFVPPCPRAGHTLSLRRESVGQRSGSDTVLKPPHVPHR